MIILSIYLLLTTYNLIAADAQIENRSNYHLLFLTYYSLLTTYYLYRYRRFYRRMTFVVQQFKIFKLKIKNIFDLRIDFHSG